ncbi:hypothetical protein [Streptomyces akebiae]|uniref:Uncharacterized protein n=1 Tax=Streptomyces akebiae TaxID=2865673 RepID=A0ABX8XU56_9ACTN|nr:hypothetical protein [Streptomyces akebiae]QYX79295.1 hypothetical protein K1J60_24715 [Streptomyces akebiae]
MTQSGQGEEPSARTAREGIVLPSDGGAPLHPSDLPPAPLPPAPAQPWDQQRPWGSEETAAPPAQPQADHWNSAPSAPEWGAHGARDAYGTVGAQAGYGAQGAYGTQDDAVGQAYGTQGDAAGQAYGAQSGAAGQAYGTTQGDPAGQAYGTHGGMPLPPEGAPGAAYGGAGYGGAGAPLPPVAGELAVPSAGASPQSPQSAPMPPVDEGATQYIPYVPAAGPMPGDEAATQFIPPVVTEAPAAEAATQFLPPVGPGALPPAASGDATTYLGRVPDNGAGPLPPAANPVRPVPGASAGNPDEAATQYIPPVAAQGQQRPPYGAPGPQPGQQQPDVFDSLFRNEPGAGGAAGSTQQMPKIDHGHAPQPPRGPGGPGGHGSHGGPGGHGGHGGHAGRASGRRESGGGGGGRTRSRVPLIALVGVGIAVLGIGAGALMAGSGDDSSPSDNKPVSASGAPEESASASADPAREQAVALDKLLADSGDSRSSVIKAVADIKTCSNLGQAATDLRDAAKQRNDLVTRLGALSVDQLPNHEALTTSLTKAWKASASADNHYAAWADQTAGKKGCKKGQARTTGQTQAGNQASATASAEKTKAAELWNEIAKTYTLTERQAVQL